MRSWNRKRLEDEIQDLNEWILELDKERKIAEANEQVFKVKYIDAVTLAQIRLHQWGKERDKHPDAQDKIAEQAKEAKRHQKKIEEQDKAAQKQQEMYAQLLEELKVVSADKIRSMQKEWDDEQAARRHGGKWWWPPWVVQLICKLLISGTLPSAVPPTIQTFSETLLHEKPKELPSVNFVCECCVIVEVIGETIAAIKLAHALKWDQLWYNGTTCQQILP